MGQYLNAVAQIPAEAAVGETVTVRVTVTAKYAGGFWIIVNGTSGVGPLIFAPEYAEVFVGIPQVYQSSFVMPAGPTQIIWNAWYLGVDGAWYEDAEGFTTVALAGGNGNGEPPPDEEESWFEKNKLLVVGGVLGITALGVVLVRK